MSLLGKLFKRRDVWDLVSQIRIGFPDDFESSWVASVHANPNIDRGMENWIWDLYYAKTLYELGKCSYSEGLNQDLEAWAIKWAGVLLSGLPFPPIEMLAIDQNLVLLELPTPDEEFVIDVIPGGRRTKGWELIQTRVPKGGHKNRMAFSVLAMAHYLLAESDEEFGRILPVHILAMQTYYREKASYDRMRSVLGAPSFAVEKETEFRKEVLSKVLDVPS